MVIIVLLVRATSRVRPCSGRIAASNGRTLTFYKFRSKRERKEKKKKKKKKTICDTRDELKPGWPFEPSGRRPSIPNDPRLTPIGLYLRKFSIDEAATLDYPARDIRW